MGVPGFFSWLLRKYKSSSIILNEIHDSVDILYIDANCLFHPQCFKVLNFYGNKLDGDKLTDKMIKRILNYINHLIAFVRPTKEVFISVDGVAPLSKMCQQRKRRYKTIQDNSIKDILKKKYDKEIITSWNNTCITPGTIFMEKLHQKLIEYVNMNNINFKIKYTYASYHSVGEGEHKILQDIKTKDNDDLIHVIYGLDADLIFLALASQKSNIYLLREEMIFKNKPYEKDDIVSITKDVGEDLNYVSIKETRNSINAQIMKIIDKQDNINAFDESIDLTNDFIVLCYFLGNDFIPNIPSIDIKTEGLDYILSNYVDVLIQLGQPLTQFTDETLTVNEIFFKMLVENLAKNEDYYFQVKYPQYVSDGLEKRRCFTDDPYDQEVWKMENMRSVQIEDPIKLGTDNAKSWKFRYYEYYYGIASNQMEFRDQMCIDYLNGIKWTIMYYFRKCPSWEWQYKFYHSPFISDINDFLNRTNYDINKIVFPVSKPLTPLVQLLAVLPPDCQDLLPNSYRFLMTSPKSPIIDLFPIDVKIDMLYKDSLHKCIPLVPNIDINRILNATSNLKLSMNEKTRNQIEDNYVVSHKV